MKQNQTITHKIAFLYLAFAHQTDGIFAKSEQLTLWKKAESWSEIQLSKGEFAQIMDEVMRWYGEAKQEKSIFNTVIAIAKELNLTPSFDYAHRLQALNDMFSIAVADKKLIVQEMEWIHTLAAIWNVQSQDLPQTKTQNTDLNKPFKPNKL